MPLTCPLCRLAHLSGSSRALSASSWCCDAPNVSVSALESLTSKLADFSLSPSSSTLGGSFSRFAASSGGLGGAGGSANGFSVTCIEPPLAPFVAPSSPLPQPLALMVLVINDSEAS
ncbi:hypothetical protein EV363DRAFT_1257233 [Boletus edulis]|uniref:Uncharacterized protein n=1 Tax=Boletus edulis BED1 TaxID=1328754 RepID=A0AAD4B978_BOLED|nr:hypothetical protein EV363DRAFT_1237114 [Boletus edulis]KAF8124821.1 hypothetical protein EV363DRAFT_1271122 [Boletus edulis]KAF8135206.1 hypothetical protein EV363DRAFT_1257233 [Boletus edulis]KAF8414494.1 hypothetical protein L210DRAFT_3769627 [Boletus edulis BED1]